jgi:hypothetical protein
MAICEDTVEALQCGRVRAEEDRKLSPLAIKIKKLTPVDLITIKELF